MELASQRSKGVDDESSGSEQYDDANQRDSEGNYDGDSEMEEGEEEGSENEIVEGSKDAKLKELQKENLDLRNEEQEDACSEGGREARSHNKVAYHGGDRGASERGYVVQETRAQIDELGTQQRFPSTPEQRNWAADGAVQEYYANGRRTRRLQLSGQFTTPTQYYVPEMPSRRPPPSRRRARNESSLEARTRTLVHASPDTTSASACASAFKSAPSRSCSITVEQKLEVIRFYHEIGKQPPWFLLDPSR